MDSRDNYPRYDKEEIDIFHDDINAQPNDSYGYHKPGAAITSMVLGICSVSLWFYPFISSIPCFIMGLVAVILARKEESRTDYRFHGFLKAGRITGVLGMILSVLYTIIILAMFMRLRS